MMYVCFHLLKEESFSVLILNLSLTHVLQSLFVTSLLVWIILVWYATLTTVMWKLEACGAQTLKMDFTVKEETSGVQQENFKK